MGVIINDKSSSASGNDNKKNVPDKEAFIKLISELAPEMIAAAHPVSEKKDGSPPLSKKGKVNRQKVLENIVKNNDTPPPPNNGDNEEAAAGSE